MALQERISSAKLRRKIGSTITVLVDERNDDSRLVARSSADAPDIDGVVHVENTNTLRPGDFVRVHVTGSDEHDLFARLATGN